MPLDPVGELLGPGRTGERQARSAQHRHEQVGIAFLASPAVDHDRHRVAGIVDEHLLAAGVALAHDQRQPAFPAAEQVAPAAVAIAVRVRGVVFLPQHLQCDVLALQLARHHRPVWFWLLASARLHPGHAIEASLQIGVRHLRWNRPGQPRPPEPPQRVADRRRPNSDPLANHPCRKPRIQAQTQNLAHMAHRNPPRRHPFPPAVIRPAKWPNDQVLPISNCARSPRNAARIILVTLRAISSESRARSNRNGARDDLGIRKLHPSPWRNRHRAIVLQQRQRLYRGLLCQFSAGWRDGGASRTPSIAVGVLE